jgi:dimethylsulfone monooxygenase
VSQELFASRPVADGTVQLSASPVFTSPNKMKLGVFATNLAGTASGISTMKGPVEIASWDEQRYYAVTADRAGFEALVPATRWKGFNSPSGYWDRTYDTWVWGGAMAAITERIQIFTTCAVPLYHPVMAAKMGATLDHASGGRWAINIVPGWFGSEFEQFGVALGDRAARYRYAQEWITLVNRLWTETEEIDFEGEFITARGAISAPKPMQSPRPLVMNAGQSEEGQEFAVNNADMIFVTIVNEDALKTNIANVKSRADELGKQVSIWSNIDIICKSTEQEARDFADAWMEAADTDAVNKFIDLMAGGDSGTHAMLMANPAIWNSMAMGGGGLTVIGTPEMLVSEFQRLSDLGVDGLTMTWHQYPEGLDQFISDVHPLMIEAGLRSEKPLDS